MTSLAPANAKFKKDFHESSPAKRSMSRKQKRKKTSHTTFREGLTPLDGMNGRPKTSYLLQNVAERMPWPKQSRGREPIDPMTPVKAFTIENEHVSPFRESYKDFRSSLDKLPEEPEFEITGLQKEDDYKTKYDMDKELRDDFINSETIVLDNKPLSSTQNKINENNANSSPIKLSKKNTSIHDIITLLQNQPNDTGQYFYLVPKKENVDKKQANKQKSLRQSIADLEDEKGTFHLFY